ncbi:ABC transporter permease [Williamsia sp. CHRR-6]|nr:ABC transporter permease [Williamsia sp. CHRR-6]
MAGRGMVKLKHSPHSLFDVIILPIVAVVLFSSLLGGAIAGSVSNYLPLLVPGVLVQVALTASVTTGVQLCEDVNKGVFDRFTSLPIARIAPLAGSLISDVLRYAVATSVTMGVGIVLGFKVSGVVPAVISCVLVITVGFAMSWIFALMGVLMGKPSSVQAIATLLLMPLTMMSNALVPTATMPSWMSAVAEVNPVSHLVSAVRQMVNDGVYSGEILWSLASAAVILAVFAPLTLRVYMRR